jgi:hypothetical protein
MVGQNDQETVPGTLHAYQISGSSIDNSWISAVRISFLSLVSHPILFRIAGRGSAIDREAGEIARCRLGADELEVRDAEGEAEKAGYYPRNEAEKGPGGDLKVPATPNYQRLAITQKLKRSANWPNRRSS